MSPRYVPTRTRWGGCWLIEDTSRNTFLHDPALPTRYARYETHADAALVCRRLNTGMPRACGPYSTESWVR